MDKICCHHHPNAPLVEDSHAGDTICSECGLVVGDRYVNLSKFFLNSYLFDSVI